MHARRTFLVITTVSLLATTRGVHAQDVSESATGHEKGDPGATTLIIEFGDFACPACAAFARETMPEIERQWIMTGRARLQFIPIDVFRTGRLAARAAECAAEQDAFWPMHDLLYARQKEWLGRGGQREKFESWARDLGLDVDRYRACWDRDPAKDRIERTPGSPVRATCLAHRPFS